MFMNPLRLVSNQQTISDATAGQNKHLGCQQPASSRMRTPFTVSSANEAYQYHSYSTLFLASPAQWLTQLFTRSSNRTSLAVRTPSLRKEVRVSPWEIPRKGSTHRRTT